MRMEETGRAAQRRREIRELYHTPANLRLKYLALAVIGVGIALMAVMIIWIDSLSLKTMLALRGCVGVCAIAFLTIVGILVYRVNSEQIHSEFRRRRKSNKERRQ